MPSILGWSTTRYLSITAQEQGKTTLMHSRVGSKPSPSQSDEHWVLYFVKAFLLWALTPVFVSAMAAAARKAAPGSDCTCVHEARSLWGLSLMPDCFIFLTQGALCMSSVPPDTFPVFTLLMAGKSTYIYETKQHSLLILLWFSDIGKLYLKHLRTD